MKKTLIKIGLFFLILCLCNWTNIYFVLFPKELFADISSSIFLGCVLLYILVKNRTRLWELAKNTAVLFKNIFVKIKKRKEIGLIVLMTLFCISIAFCLYSLLIYERFNLIGRILGLLSAVVLSGILVYYFQKNRRFAELLFGIGISRENSCEPQAKSVSVLLTAVCFVLSAGSFLWVAFLLSTFLLFGEDYDIFGILLSVLTGPFVIGADIISIALGKNVLKKKKQTLANISIIIAWISLAIFTGFFILASVMIIVEIIMTQRLESIP